jgi:hypothetical protein
LNEAERPNAPGTFADSSANAAARPSRTRIDTDDRFAVRDWAIVLEVTEVRLLAAIAVVGCESERVEHYLRGPRAR